MVKVIFLKIAEAIDPAHYTGLDLREALRLYRKPMAAHPDAQEAGYSRMQVQNLVNGVVPKQELLDAQMELALAQLEHEEPLNSRRIPVTLARN